MESFVHLNGALVPAKTDETAVNRRTIEDPKFGAGGVKPP